MKKNSGLSGIFRVVILKLKKLENSVTLVLRKSSCRKVISDELYLCESFFLRSGSVRKIFGKEEKNDDG